MPDAFTDPSDLIDPEAPLSGGERVDTPAYAAATPRPGGPGLAAAKPGGPAPGSPEPGSPESGSPETGSPETGRLGAGGAVVSRAAGGDGGLDAAVDALLALAVDRRWDEIALRDVAERAGVPFAAIYARAPSKAALLLHLGDRYDREALRAVDGDRQPQAHDRLFEAFMARLEAMAAHRDVLIAIGRAQPLLVAAGLGRTTRALAEGSGVDTSGVRGALRLAALTPVWARTLQVWRDDEGALNRTMAEIDRRLRRAARRLARVGAGF